MSTSRAVRHPRFKLLALLAVFVLPLLVAWIMVAWRIGIPEQRTAHGELEPDIPALAQWPLAEPRTMLPEDGGWVLAFDCAGACEALADQWWRLHRALGREAHRVRRLRIGGAAQALPGEVVARWSTPPDWHRPGHLWVLDPRGEAVLGYSAGVEARDVLDDVNKLLRMNPEPSVTPGRQVAQQ
ncbi:hypothetical protein MKP05_18125 [Halomonas sp. EGI 63088]|uniref:Transmembrane protein n=1 Tax=Halomonas flagellata TaxID=2920385 RepID=A0ABS9RYX6_9GAMM|nr:hypothetical protein [Halomonas flagellata]MCH4565019.1 hypothetical protein [Halomonas flagellata]